MIQRGFPLWAVIALSVCVAGGNSAMLLGGDGLARRHRTLEVREGEAYGEAHPLFLCPNPGTGWARRAIGFATPDALLRR